MSKFKSHKTVEQIARKHRLEVSFIQKQLNMGEPIEHEHTQDHQLAKHIALQHLDEIPDYYTRLKKMEADAKTHHKKFKDVKEHCGCEEKAVKELEDGLKKLDDISYNSIDKLMRRIMKKHDMTAKQLHYAFKDKHNEIPDDWIKNLKEETKSGDEGLRDWFNKSKSSDGKSGWVQLGGKWAGKPCARQEGQTSTPKCGSSKMKRALSKDEEELARRRKNIQDPNQPQKTGGAKPTNVRTEEMDLQEVKDKPSKGSGKKDACYHKVKSRYDVWPSAYASGALVKCRKVGAANWGTKSEETMQEEERYCPLCDKRETRSQCTYGEKTWDKVSVKDEEYSMARSELKTIEDAVKRLKAKVEKGEGDLEAWVQSKITKAADYIDTAADYIDSGEMEESVGFTIDSQEHKKSRKREKIRNIATRGSTEGEKSAAFKKLGSVVELPSIKKEENLVDKLTNEILDEKCWTGYKRKKGTTEFEKGSCVKKENVTIEDAEGNTFAEVIDLIKPEPIKGFKSQVEEATRLQAQTGNIIGVTLSWRGKYYMIQIFFPQTKVPSRLEISNEIQKIYPGSRVVTYRVSDFKPGDHPLMFAYKGGNGGKLGANKNYVKTMGEEAEVEVDEDWQKVNRQDKTAGLSQKAVNAYRRENPGSKLQTAVTEKNPTGKRASRRKSFCSRMSGMKKRLTSSETAKDPDSNINKALRRWNCN